MSRQADCPRGRPNRARRRGWTPSVTPRSFFSKRLLRWRCWTRTPRRTGELSLFVMKPIVATAQTGGTTFQPNVTCVKVGALGIGTSTAVVKRLTDLLATRTLDLADSLMAHSPWCLGAPCQRSPELQRAPS